MQFILPKKTLLHGDAMLTRLKEELHKHQRRAESKHEGNRILRINSFSDYLPWANNTRTIPGKHCLNKRVKYSPYFNIKNIIMMNGYDMFEDETNFF